MKLFEEKVAMNPAHMYDEKDPLGWKIMTKNYFIGRYPHMDTFLTWIEQQKDQEIPYERMKVQRQHPEICVDFDIVHATQQLWSWLNLNLRGDQVQVFRNVEKLNGAEAWRRVCGPISSSTAAKRQQLRNNAWNPKPAVRLQDLFIGTRGMEH